MGGTVSDRGVFFDHLEWFHGRSGWYMDLDVPGGWETVPVDYLVGKRADIADKDAGVYQAVAVTAFDSQAGYLVLEGGRHGSAFRPEEFRPVEEPLRLHVHDVARGQVIGDA